MRDAPCAPAVAGEYSLLRGSAGFPIGFRRHLSILMNFGNYFINRLECIGLTTSRNSEAAGYLV